MITVQAWGAYRHARATIRPSVQISQKGYVFLQINKRALRRAADACCYAGTDYPIIEAPPEPYGLWQETTDGRLIAWRQGV